MLVTHGVQWLPMVDEVIVMHDGRISERGSYEELMSHDGPFAQFLKVYLTEAADSEEEFPERECHVIPSRGTHVLAVGDERDGGWVGMDMWEGWKWVLGGDGRGFEVRREPGTEPSPQW